MNFNSTPSSGFCVVIEKERNLSEIQHTFELNNAKTFYLEKDNILLSSWKRFDDQGCWSDGSNAVVYDIDLTNHADLVELVKDNSSANLNKGGLIWRLYQKYGIVFLDRLRGAFAFALWDSNNKKLYVITDYYGLKPVVYAEDRDSFYAASRIDHILSAKPEYKQINNDAIFHYLFFQAVCTPLTIYKNIRKLEPGICLEKISGKLKLFSYYDIKYNTNSEASEKYWESAIRKQVEKAVEIFVPLSPYEKTGCFLSGGTDSSSVAGFYTQISGKQAKTFSIGFEDPKYNELEYAKIAAKHFNTEYHEYYVTPKDVLNLIESLPYIYDEPFGNASVIPAFYCAKQAADSGVEIMLGGDGGDEIFGGNERYVTNLIFQKYLELPELLRKKFIEPILDSIPELQLVYKAKRYIRRANIPNPERFYSYNLLAETNPESVFQKDFIDNVNFNSFLDIARKHYQNAAPAHDTDRLLYLDMKFTITDNDIRKVTQMVEAAGIRVRYPLLERELVDFAATIPPWLKVKWKKNRYIFKKAMKGFLPDEIINKSKHGMGLPVTPWFKKDRDMNAFLYDTLFNSKAYIYKYIAPEFINKIKFSFENESTSYYGDNLWVFLILELWLKKTFR